MVKERVLRDFFLGFIRIHILYHASKSSIYGVEIMEELARHGYSVSPGTIYPILHSLEEKNYLKSHEKIVSGKIRRYYQITRKGQQALKDSRKKIEELVREVLEES
jgi:PadR family transcriptional regulator PadR